MNRVREASIDWVSLAIQRARPREIDRPQQLAELLVDIIEHEDYLLVEDLVRWIDLAEVDQDLGPIACAKWAAALSAERRASAQAALFELHKGAETQE